MDKTHKDLDCDENVQKAYSSLLPGNRLYRAMRKSATHKMTPLEKEKQKSAIDEAIME